MPFPGSPLFPVTSKGQAQQESPSPSSYTLCPTPCSIVTPGVPLIPVTGPLQYRREQKLLTVIILEPLVPHSGTFCLVSLQPRGTDVVFFMNTVVLSLVAARKAVNFKNKSRPRGSIVITGDDRPPASTSSVERGFGFLPGLGEVCLHMGRSF